jgi:hypothetical protein
MTAAITAGRQRLSGDFAALSLALKFAFPGNRRLELQRLGSRFPLSSNEGQASGAAWGPFGRQVSETSNAHAVRELVRKDAFEISSYGTAAPCCLPFAE